MKSILSALASFAAVRKEKFTSWLSTLVMYGRDTFIRFASSVRETPSSFIRRRMRRRNAEPILSIEFIEAGSGLVGLSAVALAKAELPWGQTLSHT